MSAATITSKGQINIPKDVRLRLGVGVGDRVEFVEIQEGVFQIVVATHDIRSLKGIVAKPAKPVTIEDMDRAIIEMGGQCWTPMLWSVIWCRMTRSSQPLQHASSRKL